MDRQLEFVFTDGHLIGSFSKQYDSKDIDKLGTLLDWEAIKAKQWAGVNNQGLDLKRRKQAEFLVLGDVPKEALLGFVVYSQSVENRLLQMGVVQQKISVKPQFYFE